MISSIKRFFENNIKETSDFSQKDSEHALQLATAALLIEISKADLDVKDKEEKIIIRAVQSKFNITQSETEELIRLAEEELRDAASYHEFTALINKSFSLEQKMKIVEHLWQVAFADKEIEKHEDHLIRKIANLLYVPHRDFIAAKLRVREETRQKAG